MLQQYRKKPTVIEAIQFDGRNFAAIQSALAGSQIKVADDRKCIDVTTNHGTVTASVGDFIIKGLNGEVYPCKPDTFQRLHEPMPKVDELLMEAAAAYRRLPIEARKKMLADQRKSWVIGDLMLRHPEMTKEKAEELYAKVIF